MYLLRQELKNCVSLQTDFREEVTLTSNWFL